jgi:hypothetical protein
VFFNSGGELVQHTAPFQFGDKTHILFVIISGNYGREDQSCG